MISLRIFSATCAFWPVSCSRLKNRASPGQAADFGAGSLAPTRTWRASGAGGCRRRGQVVLLMNFASSSRTAPNRFPGSAAPGCGRCPRSCVRVDQATRSFR